MLPLWANYLVRVFAWRLILSPGGLLVWFFGKIGVHASVGYTNVGGVAHVHVPVAAVRDPADLRGARAGPASFLEASSDLGARGG